MNGLFRRTFCFLFLTTISIAAFCQVKHIGIPLIRNYPKETYNSGAQNWAIAQNKNGIMYFGNSNGLLEYDGSLWRTYKMSNNTVVRSICISDDQKIYIGAYNQCGYMEANKSGVLQFHSLLKYRKDKNTEIGEIWKIFSLKEGVVFQTFSEILLWNGTSLKTIFEGQDFKLSFCVNGVFYVQAKGKGIYKFENNKFSVLPGSEMFSETEVWSMLPISDSKIIVGTFDKGLFLYNGVDFKPIDSNASLFLKENQIFCSTILGKGLLAYGTIQNGVIVINEQGEVIQHLDRKKGIQNNTVLSLFVDITRNIWLGLDNGIDYIETNSPVSYLVQKKDIGAGYVSLKIGNYLYLGTNQGLFRKRWNADVNVFNPEKIERIANTQGQVWTLFQIDNLLLCGHDKGIFLINDLKAEKLGSINGVWKFIPVPGHPELLLLGTYSGLSILEKKSGRWVYRNHIKGFYESARFLELDDDMNVWVSHWNKGIYKLKINTEWDSVIDMRVFKSKDGLPSDFGTNLLHIDNRVLFNTSNGIYSFDYATNRFAIAPEFSTIFKDKYVSYLSKGIDNLYWFISNSEPGVLLKHLDGSYGIENTPLRKMSGSFINSFENILQLDLENVIMSVEDGFIHYNPLFQTNYLELPKCFIREVRLTNDSIIYGGNSINRGIVKHDDKLNYAWNAVKFVYASNCYADGNRTMYKYILDNFDKTWSEWTTATTKEYTNLPEGSYSFKVVARNIYGIQSNVAIFKFSVSPPWYRSIVAYLIYIVSFVFALLLLFYSFKTKFEEEKRVLEVTQTKILEEKDDAHALVVQNSQQEIVKLRNEMLELENERSRNEVEIKKKELASMATQITRKNEILEKIKQQLDKLSFSIKPEDKKKLTSIIKSIDQDIHLDEDWEKFEHYFDQVHGDFIKRLREQYPVLTTTDLKLCAYLKMNISSKEIAPLLNISVRSVEVSRYRLRKKLNLNPTDNLVDLMLSI